MNINIPTDINKIYKQYLYIINSVLSTRRLTTIEIEVLSKLLYINHLYIKLPTDKRNKILFHKLTKDKIRESVNNISKNSLNNILTSLRKKKFIEDRKLLISVPIINNKIAINFNLTIDETNKNSSN